KRITKRHEVESPYIKALLKEWALYGKLVGERPKLKELHLGGGTPTFFAPDNLNLLITELLKTVELMPDAEMSFEGHPNNTTREHLQVLYNLGFRRVSFGVQDYNPTVQKAINRIQSFEQVDKITRLARSIGYTSVGHDLIFGLPFQTKDDMQRTIGLTRQIMPDRIALYSYAHVPWIKGNGQRGFKDEDLPSADEKRVQYELAKKMLIAAGYFEIGMDHFALPDDTLAQAMYSGELHRNFMGYTAAKSYAMIGLGVSAISDSWQGFAQNAKSLEDYYRLLDLDRIPVFRGHILNQEDLIIRQHILNLMCQFRTSWKKGELQFSDLDEVKDRLEEFKTDGLVYFEGDSLVVTKNGRPFIRNICMAFDLLLQRQQPETKLFSMTI
ncbi:MAG: oxygen-independent coproporphyrinogen III oxidase, partial [Bacteroidota bacterium]